MAEKGFQETFHHTQPVEVYDDLRSADFDAISPTRSNTQNVIEPTTTVESFRPPMYGTTINPKTYDGKTNPRIWLKNYELVAEANLWNDTMKLRRLIGSLDGAAYSWYINLTESIPSMTWSLFKEELIQRFTNALDDVLLTENIVKTRQKNTDFDSYWEQKMNLIKMTSPGMSEKELKHHLLSGLNRELRNKVMDAMIVRKCDTASELRALVKEIIDIQNYQQEEGSFGRRNKYHNNERPPPEREFPPRYNPNGFVDRNDVFRMKKQIRDLQDQLALQRSGNNPSNTNFRGNQNNYNRRNQFRNQNMGGNGNNGGNRNDRNGGGNVTIEKDNNWKAKIECYNCHEFGHYSRECPIDLSRRQAEASQNRNEAAGNGERQN